MKIGILTFHRAANYGAVLQAYALQSILTKMGCDCNMIDYECKSVRNAHSPLFFIYAKGVKNKVKQLIRFPVRLRKRKLFNRFINDRLKLSNKRFYNEVQMKNLDNEYDKLIVGSDQVWNPLLIGYDPAYFLSFINEPSKKASYAASFGVSSLSDEEMEFATKHLVSISNISVREKRGADIIKTITSRNVAVVLDPTLLLLPQEWELFSQKTEKDNYILMYLLKESLELVDYTKNLSTNTGLKIISISDTLRRDRNIQYIPMATPEQWIGLIADASYIITNSFHGMAFALNFNKKVCIGLSIHKENNSSRLIDLLNLLEIPFNVNESVIDLSNGINWQKLNLTLDKARIKSISYIKEVIS